MYVSTLLTYSESDQSQILNLKCWISKGSYVSKIPVHPFEISFNFFDTNQSKSLRGIILRMGKITSYYLHCKICFNSQVIIYIQICFNSGEMFWKFDFYKTCIDNCHVYIRRKRSINK